MRFVVKAINHLSVHMARHRATVMTLVCGVMAVTSFQNCSPASLQAIRDAGGKVNVSSTSVPAPLSEKINCKFVGADVIQNRLKVKLGITPGDFPALTEAGMASDTVKRLASNLKALGKGDPANGVFDDFSCSAVKFKAAIEVMTDACVVAITEYSAKAKLFPRGVRDFDEIFNVFTGRAPSEEERAILLKLVDKMPIDKREAAVCGAVASSIEALVTI